MVRIGVIAIMTLLFSALFASFAIFDQTNAQTIVSPVPTRVEMHNSSHYSEVAK